MSESAHDEQAWLWEERAIERLLLDYARFHDEGDMDAVANLFTEDATFARAADPQTEIVGRAAIGAAFRSRPRRRAAHLVTNIRVERVSADEARVASRSALVEPADGKPALSSLATFEDEVVKRDGAWKFRSRRGRPAF